MLAGCASSTPQASAFFKEQTHLPDYQQIQGVPFVNQAHGYCGPATLTMALNWAGRPVTVDEIAPQVFTPGMKGTFQTDMVTAVRRQGLLAIPVQNLNALLNEVSAGHPVVVFQNLGIKLIP